MPHDVEDLHLAFKRVAPVRLLFDPLREEVDPVDHLHSSHVRGDGELANCFRDLVDRNGKRDATSMVHLKCPLFELLQYLLPLVPDHRDLAPEDLIAGVHFVPGPLDDFEANFHLLAERRVDHGGRRYPLNDKFRLFD